MSIQIPSGFEGVLYDQADRELRLEQTKWRDEIDCFRRAAGYLARGDNWCNWYLLPYPWSHARRELPRDLPARMSYVSDSLELDEFRAMPEVAKPLHQPADTLEAIFRERFGLAPGWLEAAE